MLQATHEFLGVFASLHASFVIIAGFLLDSLGRPTRDERPESKNEAQCSANQEELYQRTVASTRVIQIVQCPLDLPSSSMPRSLNLLMPHIMLLLIKVWHIIVRTLCEATWTSASGRRVVICPVWPARRMLRALLALVTPAS